MTYRQRMIIFYIVLNTNLYRIILMEDFNYATRRTSHTNYSIWYLRYRSFSQLLRIRQKVNNYLVDWREQRDHEDESTLAFSGYKRDSYIVSASTPRFGSGEGKGVLNDSVRGYDLYIMVDVCNYSLEYSLCGYKNHMSPDDHYADLKRVIAAAGGKARRITVIMPFLYESRQHKRFRT